MIKKERGLSEILRVLFISLIFFAISSSFVFSQTVILNQQPDQVGCQESDVAFLFLIGAADNFHLSNHATVTQLRIWGSYIPATVPHDADNFTVVFHSDAAGLPGAVLSTEINVPVSRQSTGGTIDPGNGNLPEYVYTLTLATPVILPPGTYWVEITNVDSPLDDTFCWESGAVDPLHGSPGFASFVFINPWSSQPGDLAIEITAEPLDVRAVPTISEWGMIILMALAGLASIYHLRRQRRAER